MSIVVRGVGFHFPERTITTREVFRSEQPNYLFGAKMIAEIGCSRIHQAAADESPSILAARASNEALAHAKLAADALQLVVGVSCTPADYDLWSQPAKVAQRIGAMTAECLGVGEAGCAGAFAAMRAVIPMLAMPDGPALALVAAGCVTPGGHFFPPATIFGDGAGALVLEKTEAVDGPALKVVRADLFSHPELVDAFGCQAGIDLMRTQGQLSKSNWTVGIRDEAVYGQLRTHNFELGARDLEKTLARAGWSAQSLRWLVPDNVSKKVGEELAGRIGLPLERVLSENCARYGHAFVADLFVNLRTLLDHHPPVRGDRIACAGMGLGHHWGVLLLEAI